MCDDRTASLDPRDGNAQADGAQPAGSQRAVEHELHRGFLSNAARLYLVQPVLWIIPAIFCSVLWPTLDVVLCWTAMTVVTLVSGVVLRRSAEKAFAGRNGAKPDNSDLFWLALPAICASIPTAVFFPTGLHQLDIVLLITLGISFTVLAGLGPTTAAFLAIAGPQTLALTIGIVKGGGFGTLAFAAFFLFYVLVCFVIARAVREERRKHIESRQRLVEALAEARAANTAKSKFLAAMSHELRTPLNAILGFSEVIATQTLGPVGSVKYLEYAKDIHFSGNHLLNIINDVLDLAKIEAGKVEIERQLLDPYALIEATVRMMTPRAKDRNVALRTQIHAPDLILFADERAATQALLNVVTNAVKFNRAGGEVRIELKGSAQGGVLFSVRDTGPGIPADQIERLFEPFEQGENGYNNGKNGTGLGLAIVRSLMKVHGGQVWIESTLDKGTAVFLEFPGCPEEERPERSAPEILAAANAR